MPSKYGSDGWANATVWGLKRGRYPTIDGSKRAVGLLSGMQPLANIVAAGSNAARRYRDGRRAGPVWPRRLALRVRIADRLADRETSLSRAGRRNSTSSPAPGALSRADASHRLREDGERGPVANRQTRWRVRARRTGSTAQEDPEKKKQNCQQDASGGTGG